MSKLPAFDRVFPLVYFGSGAAGLLYEVVWGRLLALRIGHTAAAGGTVLAAFMGGLAIGALLAGTRAAALDRRRAARVYALLEVAVAVLAVLTPLLLSWSLPLLQLAYRSGDAGSAFALTRVLVALMVLSLPAAAMGATLPVAVRAWAGSPEDGAHRASLLYAMNTAGAAAGALVTGFLLLPALGLMATTSVGVALNLLAASLSWLLSSSLPAVTSTDAPASTTRPALAAAPARPRAAWAPALAVAVTGAVSLTWEVAWSRILALIVGPTSYAMSTMLTTFIVGLAVGALCATVLARRTARPLLAAAAALLLAATGTLAAVVSIDRVILTGAVMASGGQSFTRVVLTDAALAAILMFPSAAAIGFVFPLAIAGLRAEREPSRAVARLYALNTSCAIAAALLASLWLIPAIGLRLSLLAGVVACAAAAVALSCTAAGVARIVTSAAGAAVIVAAALAPAWNRALLVSGSYRSVASVEGLDLESALTLGTIVYYREGAAGTVAVKDTAGTRSLVIDGKVDASNGDDMLTQSLLAHVPLLLHEAPRQAAVIGLGSGVTVGAALSHPLERIDVLEISPEVVAASELFARENRQALADSRTRLIVGDGRAHLELTRSRYDVIISEPSNPWMSGVAALFTREFFLAARHRLAPGGVVCQWAHTYDLDPADLRSIVGTFVSVFPDAALWLVGEGDILLVGSDRPLDLARLSRPGPWQDAAVLASLTAVKAASAASLLSLHVADGAGMSRFAAGAPILDDDRLRLEFSAPSGMFEHRGASNAEALSALRRAVPRPAAVPLLDPRQRRERGLMLAAAGDHRGAYQDLRFAALVEPDAATLDALVQAGVAAAQRGDLEDALTAIARRHPRVVAPLLAHSRLAAASGDTTRALGFLAEALTVDDGDADVQEQLASMLADAGDPERLEPVVARLAAARPDAPATQYYAATLSFLRGDYAAAVAAGSRASAVPSPWRARALALVGAARASLGDAPGADHAFTASLADDPRDPDVYLNRGTLYLQQGALAAAASSFAQALALSPTLDSARDALADVLIRQGQPLRAAAVREASRR